MMDDMLVHGKTQKEHDDRLHEALQRMQQTGMTLNPFAGARNNCAHTPGAGIFVGFNCLPFLREEPSYVRCAYVLKFIHRLQHAQECGK